MSTLAAIGCSRPPSASSGVPDEPVGSDDPGSALSNPGLPSGSDATLPAAASPTQQSTGLLPVGAGKVCLHQGHSVDGPPH